MNLIHVQKVICWLIIHAKPSESKNQKKLDVSKKQVGKKLNIEDPNLKSCLQKSFSQKAYNEIFLQGLRPPEDNEKKRN